MGARQGNGGFRTVKLWCDQVAKEVSGQMHLRMALIESHSALMSATAAAGLCLVFRPHASQSGGRDVSSGM